MKKNSGGLWFSKKQAIKSRSVLVQDIGVTVNTRSAIAARLESDPALRTCPKATSVLKAIHEGKPSLARKS